jgi:hypothetical protein
MQSGLSRLWIVKAIKQRETEEADLPPTDGSEHIDVAELVRELAELRQQLRRQPVTARS